jgi:Rod binding domain-containing protein
VADTTGIGAQVSTSLLDAQTGRVLAQAHESKAGGIVENARIEKSAKDFESILLGSWLQQAEKSFASVPGEDEDEDEDPGKDQFQSMGMQSLAGSLVASGGIGIARMISSQLHTIDDRPAQPQPEEKK